MSQIYKYDISQTGQVISQTRPFQRQDISKIGYFTDRICHRQDISQTGYVIDNICNRQDISQTGGFTLRQFFYLNFNCSQALLELQVYK